MRLENRRMLSGRRGSSPLNSARNWLLRLCATVAVTLGCQSPLRAQMSIENLEDPSKWTASGSDGVKSTISADESGESGSLRVDFDFQRGSGFVTFRREVEIDLPPNWKFTFNVRGECPPNNFEFKLIDETGDNVWWVNKRGYEFPSQWAREVLKKRQFSFAWGPGGVEKGLTKVRAIEIAIAAGSGGKGSVWIDGLKFEETAEAQPAGPIRLHASSFQEEHEPPLVLPASGLINWISDIEDGDPWLELDFCAPREFGGLSILFGKSVFPSQFVIECPDGVSQWRTVYAQHDFRGGMVHIPLKDHEAERVRIRSLERRERLIISTIRVRDLSFSESSNSFIRALAHESPRGRYPRAFLEEQSYWTVVGARGDEAEALISDDGAIELGKGGPTIEPFLSLTGDDAVWLSWADVEISHSLVDGSLPIPSVMWRHKGLSLETTAFVEGPREASVLNGVYRLGNKGTNEVSGKLVLALRPFQALPHMQELNMNGGVAPISTVQAMSNGLAADMRNVELAQPYPGVVGMAAPFVESDCVGGSFLYTRTAPFPDKHRLASGAMMIPFTLAPGQVAHFGWRSALSEQVQMNSPFHERESQTTALRVETEGWRAVLDRVSFTLPPAAQRYADTFRSQVAYILINRDGPAIQPGSRSYDRTWIRDGALTSTALLYAGHPEAVRTFIDWFAPFQYDDGKVPCCADERGPDPVPEHDSHGQYIYAVAEYDRFMHDGDFLRNHAARVSKAVEYIESLRAQRMTDQYKNAEGLERAKYGLVPESISHEGYSAKPMHSYWDDFWVLRGLEDAAYLGGRIGDDALEARAAAAAASMRACLYDSMRLAMQIKGIDYIPGCVELGDFDATSTSIGLFPVGEIGRIPEPQLTNTFDRYVKWFDDRASGATQWKDYTPYEIRNTTTFLLLGRREVTHRMMDFFFKDQRPAGWNAWAEVVRNGYRTPGFLGDIPHTWVGSDFVKLLRTMFVHERGDGALVVGLGITKEWIEGGAAASHLPTHYGEVSVTFGKRDGARLVTLEGDIREPPPGGIEIALEDLAGSAIDVDGQPTLLNDSGRLIVPWPVREVVIRP